MNILRRLIIFLARLKLHLKKEYFPPNNSNWYTEKGQQAMEFAGKVADGIDRGIDGAVNVVKDMGGRAWESIKDVARALPNTPGVARGQDLGMELA